MGAWGPKSRRGEGGGGGRVKMLNSRDSLCSRRWKGREKEDSRRRTREASAEVEREATLSLFFAFPSLRERAPDSLPLLPPSFLAPATHPRQRAIHETTKCKTFHMKISFVCMWMKTNFHNTNFALSLAFIMRFTATRKWLILAWYSRCFPSYYS